MTIKFLTKKCLNPFIYGRFAGETKQQKDIKKGCFWVSFESFFKKVAIIIKSMEGGTLDTWAAFIKRQYKCQIKSKS